MCYPSLSILAHMPCQCSQSYTPSSTSCHEDMTLLHLTIKAQTESAVLVGHSCCVLLPSQIFRCSTSGKSGNLHTWFFQIPAMSGNRSKKHSPFISGSSITATSTMSIASDSNHSQSVCICSSCFEWNVRNQRAVFFLHRRSLLQVSLFFSSAGQGMIHPSKCFSLPSQKYPPSSSTALPTPLWLPSYFPVFSSFFCFLPSPGAENPPWQC